MSTMTRSAGHRGMDEMSPTDPRLQNQRPTTSVQLGPGTFEPHALVCTGAPEPSVLQRSHHTLPLHKDPARTSVAFKSPERDKTIGSIVAEKRLATAPAYWLPHDYGSWTKTGVRMTKGTREIAAERWGATLRQPRPPPDQLSPTLEDPQVDMTSRPATCAAYLRDRNAPSYRTAFLSGVPRTLASGAHRKKDTRVCAKSYEQLLATGSGLGPGSFNTDVPGRFRSHHAALKHAPEYITQGTSILPPGQAEVLLDSPRSRVLADRGPARNTEEAARLAGLGDADGDDDNNHWQAAAEAAAGSVGPSSPRRAQQQQQQQAPLRSARVPPLLLPSRSAPAPAASPAANAKGPASPRRPEQQQQQQPPQPQQQGLVVLPASPLAKFRPRAPTWDPQEASAAAPLSGSPRSRTGTVFSIASPLASARSMPASSPVHLEPRGAARQHQHQHQPPAGSPRPAAVADDQAHAAQEQGMTPEAVEALVRQDYAIHQLAVTAAFLSAEELRSAATLAGRGGFSLVDGSPSSTPRAPVVPRLKLPGPGAPQAPTAGDAVVASLGLSPRGPPGKPAVKSHTLSTIGRFALDVMEPVTPTSVTADGGSQLSFFTSTPRGGALASLLDDPLRRCSMPLHINTRLPGDEGIVFLKRNILHRDLIKRQLKAVADLKAGRGT